MILITPKGTLFITCHEKPVELCFLIIIIIIVIIHYNMSQVFSIAQMNEIITQLRINYRQNNDLVKFFKTSTSFISSSFKYIRTVHEGLDENQYKIVVYFEGHLEMEMDIIFLHNREVYRKDGTSDKIFNLAKLCIKTPQIFIRAWKFIIKRET